MTKETFDRILNDNGILWNDIVVIEVFNPNHKNTFFNKIPKTITFEGALSYFKNSKHVDLLCEESHLKINILHFDFEQIVGINLKNKKNYAKN